MQTSSKPPCFVPQQLVKAFHVIHRKFPAINLKRTNPGPDWISDTDAQAAMMYAVESGVIYQRPPGASCCKCFLLIIDEVSLC